MTVDEIIELLAVCRYGGDAESLVAAKKVSDTYEILWDQRERITEWANKMVDQRNEARVEADKMKNATLQFAEAILHGSEEHRTWLLEAAQCFAKGQAIPVRRG